MAVDGTERGKAIADCVLLRADEQYRFKAPPPWPISHQPSFIAYSLVHPCRRWLVRENIP
jgi:hypothetical protein